VSAALPKSGISRADRDLTAETLAHAPQVADLSSCFFVSPCISCGNYRDRQIGHLRQSCRSRLGIFEITFENPLRRGSRLRFVMFTARYGGRCNHRPDLTITRRPKCARPCIGAAREVAKAGSTGCLVQVKSWLTLHALSGRPVFGIGCDR